MLTVTYHSVQNQMPLEKAADMVQVVSRGIEQYCQCEFPSDYITDTEFLCDEDSNTVIFQGRIITTNEKNSLYLVDKLEMWISNEPTVVIQSEQVRIISQQGSSSRVQTAVGTSAAVLILLLLMAIVVTSVLYCRRRHTRYCSGYLIVCFHITFY